MLVKKRKLNRQQISKKWKCKKYWGHCLKVHTDLPGYRSPMVLMERLSITSWESGLHPCCYGATVLPQISSAITQEALLNSSNLQHLNEIGNTSSLLITTELA